MTLQLLKPNSLHENRGDSIGSGLAFCPCWPQRLRSVFGIDIKTCTACRGTLRIIACIEDPAVIKAILAHLADKARPVHAARQPPGRTPPVVS